MEFAASLVRAGRVFGAVSILAGILVLALASPLAWADDDEGWSQEKEIAEARQWIEETGGTWEAGPTSINAIPPSERGNVFGYIPISEDEARKHAAGVLEPLPRGDLPESWDWRTMGGTTAPRNQYGCGSCWAFAAVGALEGAYKIATGTEILFSEQQCISCNEYGYGCNGGQMNGCYDLWMWFGAVRRTCMPYQYPYTDPCIQDECDVPVRLNDYVYVGYGEENLKTGVMNHPVAVVIHAPWAFQSYGGGCYNGVWGQSNHAILCCGWDNSACYGNGAWLIKNSWGTGWGEGGYGWVQFGSSSFGAMGQNLDLDLPVDARVAYRSHEIVGGNGVLDPSETAQMSIDVTNYGYGNAANIVGLLRSLTPGVTVIDDTAEFPDLGSWRTGTSLAAHFTVQAGPELEVGTMIEFELQIVCDQANDVSTFSDFIGPVTTLYSTDFEDGAPDWSHAPVSGVDDWQLGSPRVFDGQWDPKEAFSGDNLFGNDLNDVAAPWNGLYPVNAHSYLESPGVDCSGQTGVHLQFCRWLTSEESRWDVASVLVDGNEVWRNEYDGHHRDKTWVPINIDISEYADDNANVQIRFDMESDAAWEYGGWNIDDVRVIATNQGAQDIEPVRPSRLSLTVSSRPNPFVSMTSLRLTIPADVSEASLTIFDASGRMIRTLHEGAIDSGMHAFSWIGKDEQGQPVPAGTYYCRAQSGEASVVTRMIRLQ
ncbi:MAG: hypothetical protein KAY24_00700 [Candidatus Eisenbacteria sp.]|nr:hypothetical protein [Candidatus Eisenbacteria bacterium]